MLSHTAPVSVSAGSYLYTDLFWQIDQGTADPPANLSLSLRLYDSSGQLVAQRDGPALPPGAPLQTATVVRQPLALPIAANTQPGTYSLELVVYRADTGVPLSLPEGPRVREGQRWVLGAIQVTEVNLRDGTTTRP